MRIEIPEIAVVALIGASGSGKSTFARRYFKPTEVLSSDFFRALISDDENNQQATPQAFETLYYVAGKRLERGLLTVIDATNVQKEARGAVLRLAKEQNCQAAAIVLDMPERLCRERNGNRPDRNFDGYVITRQTEQLRRSIKHLHKEGFRYVYVLKSEEEAADVEIVRAPLWNNKKAETGPFDIIGDVHGCYDELCVLLQKLGYAVDKDRCAAAPPEGRKAVFLGDLCDRGPHNIETLRLVMGMVQSGAAYCVAGNHDVKLLKKLRGGQTQLTHGLDKTVEQMSAQSEVFVAEVIAFLDHLISHYVLDGGRLVVAHAGLKEKYQGRGSGRVRDFCLYGDTTGETDEYGLPVRLPWANEYRGKATVVYGHTPTPEVEAVNNTFCIDTGCVFGGKLTAFRYPERETVQAEAAREYYPPVRPFHDKSAANDDVLNIDDVLGERYLTTRLRRSVKINAENSAAALEVMSRFAADPHWLIYLPPTMSPCETSKLPDYLEYPTEAFDYYKTRGVGQVVCEQKHMGSRAVIVLCRDADAAARRFKMNDGSLGIIYTRTGRRFFDGAETENALLARLRAALAGSGFWSDFHTDWVCMDTELMPWSAKARRLLEEQYAPAGRSGGLGLAAAVDAIGKASAALGGGVRAAQAGAGQGVDQGIDLSALLERYQARASALDLYTEAYRRYCWDVRSVDDYRIAPFHILATEGKTWSGENHMWHMETVLRYIIGSDPVFMKTDHLLVDLSDANSAARGVEWWERLTAAGGEGMVVKPRDFIAMRGAELLQPAVKCRGREYLRIIYGPEYMLDGNLERLKKRSLSRKSHLALSEFALGMESLERFARGEPLYRVHECVFGVLALESEPVDPRL
ncbi:MAG: polynucleotide kinase-phosphatase [Peptococcaceae bacterium]|jgi:protein phosphatase|nr:polynucleotide kinase-phosphatase [Peptococcaceae bacterium]